jgi:hypothetical protein
MRKTLTLLAFSAVCSVAAFGADWSGKLIDANCYGQTKTVASCDATTTTSAFVLEVSGKIFTLDANGNTKAMAAVKNRADRAADPNNPQSKEVIAKVSGTESGGTITVDSVDVQ